MVGKSETLEVFDQEQVTAEADLELKTLADLEGLGRVGGHEDGKSPEVGLIHLLVAIDDGTDHQEPALTLQEGQLLLHLAVEAVRIPCKAVQSWR